MVNSSALCPPPLSPPTSIVVPQQTSIMATVATHLLFYKVIFFIIFLNVQNIVCLENKGFANGDLKFELNPYHSYFIITKNESNTEAQYSFTLKLIEMLVKGDAFFPMRNKDSKLPVEVPLVSILIEGEPENASTVLSLMKKQIPVVVLRGSGGLADIIAYAYFLIWDAFSDASTWDPDYIEEHVKPQLSSKIGDRFIELKRNQLFRSTLRDQVIEMIRLCRAEGREYLTILDMHKPNLFNLSTLSEHLLKALLKSRRNLQCFTHEQIHRDFDLILDWNCPQLANNLLFTPSSLNITEQFRLKFLSALTRPNREQFIELFLSHGFQLHRFLSPSRMSRLFRNIHEHEFFHTVCWESALGQSSNSKQSKFFIESELNWLIEFCTGLNNFVNTAVLHKNAQGNYTHDSLSAERKALTLLAIWAVMQNRYELVKVLWKYSDHPVHLALIISMLYDRLSYNVMDINTKAEMNQKSKQFAEYANGVLDRAYNEDISQAYNVLRESIEDWNYMTAVDIAASGQMKHFLAHPCCQKWLTTTFQGKIRLREINWGFFTVNVPIKILLCSLLIFPMYIWVRFKEDERKDLHGENTDLDEEFDVYETMYETGSKIPFSHNLLEQQLASNTEPASNLCKEMQASDSTCYSNKAFQDTEIGLGSGALRQPRREVFVNRQPPLWKMVHMMWCSPITKFYTSQVFYVIFLVIISLAALYPNCGSLWLDSTTLLWTLLIVMGQVRHAYILFISYPSISVTPKILEILFLTIFTSVFGLARLGGIHFISVYGQKVFLVLALVYFYFRLISIYLPISPTVGPLLYRLRIMITVDFRNYIQITGIVLLANGIALRALSHPNNPLTIETFSSIFHQSFLSLISNNPQSYLMDAQTNSTNLDGHCRGKETESELSSWVLYMFVFQFYIVLKLIVLPLLFSLFAATASKWVSEIDTIWKFQRYQLVIDFSNRLAVPAPFSLFYYIYVISQYLFQSASSLCKRNVNNWQKQKESPSRENRRHNIISHDDCLYWKQLADEYLEKERANSVELKMRKKEWEYIQEISEEMAYEKKVLRVIKAKIVELEKNCQQGTRRQVAAGEGGLDSGEEAPLSRLSPYPGTAIARYPLAKKYIAWDVTFFAYEPVCYTKPAEEFDVESGGGLFIDEDILRLKEQSFREKTSNIQVPSHKWNDKELERSGLLIDRRSWHTAGGAHHQAKRLVEYRIEDNLVPLNPHGRTGIRGRGDNRRWGPNHHFILAVARIRTDQRGNKHTRFLFEMDKHNKLRLIERYVNNECEIYGHFARLFQLEGTATSLQELKERLQVKLGPNLEDIRLVKWGYWDHPSNTDNSWNEANLYVMQLAHCRVPVPLASSECRCTWCPLSQETIAGLSLTHAHAIQLLSEVL